MLYVFFSLMPTTLLSSRDRSLNLLSSSKDDNTVDEISASDHYFNRDKRFFINKNQFIVSSTLTTFSFVNTTVTVTANLIPPALIAANAGACDPAGAKVPQCIPCLPAGYVVCPAVNG
jgi:hypothetical protein